LLVMAADVVDHPPGRLVEFLQGVHFDLFLGGALADRVSLRQVHADDVRTE